MLSQGFRVQHRSLPSELLITHRRAAGSDRCLPVPIHTFLSNVAPEVLRVVNQAYDFHRKPPLQNVSAFKRWVNCPCGIVLSTVVAVDLLVLHLDRVKVDFTQVVKKGDDSDAFFARGNT